MGFADRKADAKEMHLMKSLLRQSLQEGAFAMTTGLIYPPGCYTDTDELIELSKELPAYGAIYDPYERRRSRRGRFGQGSHRNLPPVRSSS